MAMYHTVLPNHWNLTQKMNNNSKFNSHSDAAFYTGISELVPVIGTTTVLSTPCSSHDALGAEQQSSKPPLWMNNRSANYRSNVELSCKDAAAHQPKGTKRRLDFGGKSSNSDSNMKRRTDWDDNNVSNGTRYRPPNKRPMLTPSPTSTIHKAPLLPLGSPDPEDKLSQDIWAKFCATRQTDEVYMRKMRLRDAVYLIVQEAYSYCGLYVVGSSMNGFGGNSSDMDMCLMLTHSEIDQKSEATTILRVILKSLKKCNYIQKLELIRAKVPILKFRDSVSGVEVDLNVNNSVGIRNTHLLKCYSKMDWRVRPLVHIIKIWARMQDINDAKSMTISSYSLVLMVIHYLQCGVSPPVLPCLQKVYPSKFVNHSDIRSITLNEDLPQYHSVNGMNLGELLIGFLDYFSHRFNFSTEAMSVRNGNRLPKHVVQNQQAIKNNHGQWKCLCIEEPFDLTNTARSVYDDDVFQRVKLVFRTSWRRLEDTKDLQSIMHG